MKHDRFVIEVNLENFIVILICAASFALILFSTQNYYNYVLFSFSARMLIVLNLSLFVVVMLNRAKIRLKTWNGILILFGMIVSAVFSYYLHPSGSTGDFFISLAGYIAIPLYMLVAKEVKLTEKTKKIIIFTGVICALTLIYLGLFHPVYRIGSTSLSYGYSNSNRAGIYLMLIGALLLMSIKQIQGKKNQGLVYLIVVILIYMVALTQCRTAFFILLASFVYQIIPKAPLVGKKFLVACTLLPLFFSFVYVYLYNKGLLLDVEILGKPIYSGREDLFVIEFIGFSLFGDYSVSGIGGLNLGIGLLNGVGIVGALLFYTFMFYYEIDLAEINSKKKGCYSKELFCFGTLMLHSCTEVTLFTGGSVCASLMGLILMISYSDINYDSFNLIDEEQV